MLIGTLINLFFVDKDVLAIDLLVLVGFIADLIVVIDFFENANMADFIFSLVEAGDFIFVFLAVIFIAFL